MGGSDDLRVGVLGAGGRGSLAWNAHRPGDGSRLVLGCDVDDRAIARAKERFRERFGDDLPIVRDYRELLDRDDIDAVFVTTPDYLHEEHAVAALEAGKAVYLEKPMAITIEGCDRILRAAHEREARLYLGHNMRHMWICRKMKELVDSGRIGEPKVGWCRHFVCYGCDAYFKDWHAERRYSTGLLLQKAAHDIDILHWVLGAYTTRVNAMGGLTLYDRIEDRREPDEPPDTGWHLENWPPLAQKGLNPTIDVEDVSMMQMQLEAGRFASYQQCHYAPDGWRNYTIIGTEGRLENFGTGPGRSVIRLWNRRVDYNPYGDEQFFNPPDTGGHGGADPRIVAEFIRYVREGGTITTSPVAARQSVAAGCMATDSLRHGGEPR
ncbi:MAG: Gfo/Idh/MocA family protein, partial [Planctomycetota bacterium]